jgi:hypothetical protein
MLNGINKSTGENLLEVDLKFEIDVQALGLNDRSSSKTVVIPRQQILSDKKLSEVAKDIITEYPNETDPLYATKIEAKILIMRNMKDKESLR